MIVSLPTTYLYAFLYRPSYYLPLKPPYRSKFKQLVLCGMLPPPRISITIIHKLLLSATDVPHEVLRCTNPNCNDEAHRTLLSNLYNDIIKLLKDAADVIPTKANNTSSKYTILGWNDLVRDSHQAARESFLFWCSAGSPRHGPLYDIMKIRRAHFKRNKRLCEKNAEILKAERLASKLCNNDFKNFWKDIKHMNNARLPNPSNVGGASGVENVKNMWLHHYQSLLNSIPGSPANI